MIRSGSEIYPSKRSSMSSDKTKKILSQLNRFLDVRMGLIGAFGMGLIVYYINCDHGVVAGFIAALKQGLYTFFFGALFVRMSENIAASINDRLKAVLLGGITPALLTSALTYVLHAIKGTPEPFHSTVPTMILSLLSFSTWAYLKHRSTFASKDDLV